MRNVSLMVSFSKLKKQKTLNYFFVTFCKRFINYFYNMQWYLKYYFVFFLSVMKISLCFSCPHSHPGICKNHQELAIMSRSPSTVFKRVRRAKSAIVPTCFYIEALLSKLNYIPLPATSYLFGSCGPSGSLCQMKSLLPLLNLLYIFEGRELTYTMLISFYLVLYSYFILQKVNAHLASDSHFPSI